MATASLVLVAAGTSAVIFRPDRAIRVATALWRTMSVQDLVSGLDPQTVFAETTDRAGMRG